MNIEDEISKVRAEFEKAKADTDLGALRAKFTGRNGLVRGLFKLLGKVPKDQKAGAGQALNQLKKDLEAAIENVASTAGPKKAAAGVDITLPGTAPDPGRRHPIYRTWEEIQRVFLKLGFDVAYGPEIEDEYHNFEALNIPLDHAARDSFDTFYLGGDDKWLLRSHTSPVQIRTMKETQPPIRIIAPGKVFRPDTPDAGHSPMFHQVEGLMVGEDVTFAQLKGVLLLFAQTMWGKESRVRFRPSFFPFTEPSAEVDISCFICNARGCPACKQSGWVEILGSGMVHPKVLDNCGIDSEKYTGFAFGMGVERIAMLKYKIPDIRLLYENHFGFLGQF